ncbi:MAG: hypothetical protein NVS9B4_04750 [Candidatus Acidiferrum sp.]
MENLNAEVQESQRHHLATRQQKLAVCSGETPLSAADRVEILVTLSSDADAEVAQQATGALAKEPVESFIEALLREPALDSLFAYAAENWVGQPGVADALVQNKNCPAKYLVTHVASFSLLNVQSLLDSLDRVCDSTALVTALLESPLATVEHKRVLQELLSPETPLDVSVLAEAAEEAEPDLARRQTLLQRLGKMTVSERVQFAIKGGSEARRTLIRDSNKVVQRAVLQSPRLTDQEVEAFASMSSLPDEILRLIANNRAFRKNYAVVRNLMSNAKTPLDVSLHMLPILNPIDLKRLIGNKNVPETLRSTANKLQRVRAELRK